MRNTLMACLLVFFSLVNVAVAEYLPGVMDYNYKSQWINGEKLPVIYVERESIAKSYTAPFFLQMQALTSLAWKYMALEYQDNGYDYRGLPSALLIENGDSKYHITKYMFLNKFPEGIDGEREWINASRTLSWQRDLVIGWPEENDKTSKSEPDDNKSKKKNKKK